MAAEKNYENRIKKFLDDQGAWGVKFFANAFTKSGIPDLLYCLNGRFVAIEVKAENGRLSELQKYNLKKIQEAGGIAVVTKPSQFEELKELLIKIKNEV